MMVAGIGFRDGATVEALQDAVRRAAGDSKIHCVAVPWDKAQDEVVTALAVSLSAGIRPVFASEMKAIQTPTQSAIALRHRGTGSVAEACALAAAGQSGQLVTGRVISGDRMATCATATKGQR